MDRQNSRGPGADENQRPPNAPNPAGKDAVNAVNEDEIDLVDLLLVLVRHRRLILGITAAAVLLAAAYVWFIPQRKFQAQQENPDAVSIVVGFNRVVSQEYPANVGLLTSMYQDSRLILQALKEAGFTKLNEGTDKEIDLSRSSQEILSSIEEYFFPEESTVDPKKMKYTVSRIYGDKEPYLEITLRSEQHQKAKDFLASLSRITEARVMEFIYPLLEHQVSSYEKIRELFDNQGGEIIVNLVQDMVEKSTSYQIADALLQGEMDPILIVEPPYITEKRITLSEFRSDALTKGAVLVVAALFFAVFLAFLVNAVQGVKEDPESMAKFRAAWKGQ